jgi:hypothetical protein
MDMMLPFQLPGTSQRADVGEQMVSAVVQTAIRALLTRVEDLQVTIQCQPVSKLLMGAIDSFRLQGRGLVIKNQFRVDSMRVETDAIAIDLGSTLAGRVRLNRSLEAVAAVVLREEDINQSFEAPLVVGKMRGIPAGDGSGETLAFAGTRVTLETDNWISFKTRITFEGSGREGDVAFRARLGVEEQRRIVLSSPEVAEGGDRMLAELFVSQFNRIMDVDKFNLDGATLRIHRLRVRDAQLIFEGRAKVAHFPGTHGR